MSDWAKTILRSRIEEILPLIGEFHIEHPEIVLDVSHMTHIDASDVCGYLKAISDKCLEDTGVA